jgi:hypothetical protein
MPKNRRDLQNELIKKAMTDQTFKQALLSSPKDTIAKFLGTKLPDQVQIKVVEEDQNTFYLVLPPEAPAGKGFSNEDLESFAAFGKGTGATAIQFGICC